MSTSVHGLPGHLARHVPPSTRYLAIAEPLVLECGAKLDGVVIAYQTWGRRENADRAVLVCHALTGSADVEAWWPGIIGKDGAFDPEHDYIVCSNIIGSCYGSTGPASPVPGGGERYRAGFPRVTVRDMVHAQRRLIDHLGIDEIDVVTGPSLGGMQVLEWALCYPERVRSIVPIGVGARHSPWCIAISEAQRAAIYADPNWRGGDYGDDARPEAGLAAARMMAVCSYRSRDSFESRFGRELKSADEYQVQSYLRHQGSKINGRFDANTYVRLTQAMNDHDVARGRGHCEDVLAALAQPALVVSVSSDILYPPQEQAYLASLLPNARYEILDSLHGHDGFLIESRELAARIGAFRGSLSRGGALRAGDFGLVSAARQ